MKNRIAILFALILFIAACGTPQYKPVLDAKTSAPTLLSANFDWQGHRGCRGLLPENSIPAFLKALELGVTTLELDLAVDHFAVHSLGPSSRAKSRDHHCPSTSLEVRGLRDRLKPPRPPSCAPSPSPPRSCRPCRTPTRACRRIRRRRSA